MISATENMCRGNCKVAGEAPAGIWRQTGVLTQGRVACERRSFHVQLDSFHLRHKALQVHPESVAASPYNHHHGNSHNIA